MPDVQLSEDERKVLSYCARGASTKTAEERISTFFQMPPLTVRAVLNKLRQQGLVIESKGVAGISVYQTSPIKVRSSMIDQRVVEQLVEMERGAKAGGFKKKTFDPETGAVTEERPAAKPKPAAKKGVDLGFDIE
jgi:hypothetical protein